MKMRLWIGTALLVLAVFAAGCGQQEVVEQEEVLTPVTVKPAATGVVSIADSLSGTLQASEEILVIPEMSGEILQVHVDVGDEVRAGQTLVTLNKRDLEIQAAQAQAAVASAEIQYANAKDTYERYQRLYEEGAIAFQQVDSARVQYESIRDGSLRQARASLDQIRNMIGNAVVTSPMTGVIGTLDARAGQLASPGAPLATVIDIDTVNARFSLSESQINQVSPGQALAVFVPAVSGEPIEAVVTRISPQADPRTREFFVDLSIENNERLIRAGMTVTVELSRQEVQDELVVPEDAIRCSAQGDYLYVVRDAVARRVMVETLLSDGTHTAVRGDLQEDDDVIVLGMERVTDGTRVQIVGREE